MQRIDERRLENDLAYRFQYIADFIGFGDDDIAAIHAAADVMIEKASSLVDAVYVKLFQYDATKRHFVPRQFGYEGPVPSELESLELDHDMIAFRKQHLGRYFTALVTRPYDSNFVNYLDMVGKMHTSAAGNRTLHVPLIQMNVLLGFVADALTTTILHLGLDPETQERTLRAFQKLLWIQSDLVSRHYVNKQPEPVETAA